MPYGALLDTPHHPLGGGALDITRFVVLSQRLSVLLPVATTVVCYTYAGCVDGILQWPWLFPSIVFMDVPAHNTSHVLSVFCFPLAAIALAGFGVARYACIRSSGCAGDPAVQRANLTSLLAQGCGVVALVGLVACTITDNPPAHYAFATVLFIAFTVDVLAQMAIDRRGGGPGGPGCGGGGGGGGYTATSN